MPDLRSKCIMSDRLCVSLKTQAASVVRCRESRPGLGDPEEVFLLPRRAPQERAGVPAGASWASDSAVLQPSYSLKKTTRPGPHHAEAWCEGVALTLRQTCPWPKPRAQFAFKDSMIHVQCRSHYVSHFAAFFIVARAKISVVESCLVLVAESARALR